MDRHTDEVYVLDDHAGVWKVGDWKKPRFVKVPVKTASIAIDGRNRHLYARTLADGSSSYSVGKVARFHLDRDDYGPANLGKTGSNRLTPAFHHEWCFTGNGDKGIAVAPNGNLAVVGDPKDGLRVFAGTEDKLPWPATTIAKLPDAAGGVRFDLQGNLYVGYVDRKPKDVLRGFDGDRFAGAMGRIHKYADWDAGERQPVPEGAGRADSDLRRAVRRVRQRLHHPHAPVRRERLRPDLLPDQHRAADRGDRQRRQRNPALRHLRQPRLAGGLARRPDPDQGHPAGLPEQCGRHGPAHLRRRHGEPAAASDQEGVPGGSHVPVTTRT
ncbi:MAG: hypothetical protein U0840_28405 [Gemmataceae bacterium]